MERVGKYEIVQRLMSTGFSDIYIAEDPDLKCTVAVKVFHLKGDNVGEKAQYGYDYWRSRFIEEPRVLASLDHPNIVNVLYMDETETGEPYFVMPFLEANLLYEIGEDAETPEEIKDLPKKWRPRPTSPHRAFEVWRQVLGALAALHSRHLVHRDVKPSNVLLTAKVQGKVKLCDFGMVKVPNAKGSRPGIWVGTLDYISPEQRRSAMEVDARSDVYSAAVLLYRMLIGNVPEAKRPPLRAGRVGIPQGLVALVEDCLKKNPDDRPTDAGEVLRRFDQLVPDLSVLPTKNRIVARASAVKVITKANN